MFCGWNHVGIDKCRHLILNMIATSWFVSLRVETFSGLSRDGFSLGFALTGVGAGANADARVH